MTELAARLGARAGTSFPRAAMSLAIGGLGAAAFWFANSPLPWMIGAMTVVTALAVSGLPVQSYRPLRTVMVAVLGVMLGGSFTPDLVASAARWPPSLAFMALNSAIALTAGYFYFRYAVHADPVTAYFAAAPGGLNEMTIAGGAPGGVAEMSLVALALSVDVAFVATHHAARMVLVVPSVQPLFHVLKRLRGK